MSDRTGQQFGNYRLVRLLGQGGFAEVYLGEHIHLQKRVAIKVLSNQLGSTDLQGFIREAQTITALEHPHIVRVFDFGIQENVPFLVMDYAPNGTLRQRHSKESRVPLDDVLSYVQQIAAALQHAHDQTIIHRDVKPENMLLGSQGEILLSDFGIAVTTATSTSHQRKTTAGTVAYMAPEQIMGKPCMASDQYALGIIVYEWLAGAQPFHGSLFEIYAQHLHAPVPALRTTHPEIPTHIAQSIAKALSKDPKERFDRIQDFARALQDPTFLEALLEISTPTEIGQDDPTFVNAPQKTPVLPEIGQDDPTVVKPQLDVLPLPNTDQNDTTDLKTRLMTPTAHQIDQEQPNTDQNDTTDLKTRLMTPTSHQFDQAQPMQPKEGFQAIVHVTTEPSLASAAIPPLPPPLPNQGQHSHKPKPRTKKTLIMAAGSMVLVLLVIIYFLLPSLSGVRANLFTPHPTNTPTQQVVQQPAQQPTQPGQQPIQQPTQPGQQPVQQPTQPGQQPAQQPTQPGQQPTQQPTQPGQQPVQRTLSSTQTQSSTVNATGQGTSPAVSARGKLLITNEPEILSPLNLVAGTAMINNNGCGNSNITIIIDTAISLPAPDGSGIFPSMTVPAHVQQAGSSGNFTATCSGSTFYTFEHCEPTCLSPSALVWETHPVTDFTGGQDATTYTVVQQSDIDNAATPLKTSTTQAAVANINSQLRSNEHLVGNPQCNSNITSDHNAGDQANQVTVTVTTTCTATAST